MIAATSLFLGACAPGGAGGAPAPSVSPSAPSVIATHLPGAVHRWAGGSSEDLATVKVESLTNRPGALVRVRVERHRSEPGAKLEQPHGAGFVYAISGTHQLTLHGRVIQVAAGQASFDAPLGTVHTHSNPGNESATWYFVSIDIADRERLGSSGEPVFASPELPELPTGSHPGGSFTLGYTESLRLLRLEPGATTPWHYPVGYEAIFVLEGSVELRPREGRPRRIGAGDGFVVSPRQIVEIANAETTEARVLLFFATPGGEPYQVDVAPPR